MSYRKSSSDEVREWFYLLAEMAILPLVGTIACHYAGNGLKEGDKHVCQPIYDIIGWVQSKFTHQNVALVLGVVGSLTANKKFEAAAGTITDHFKQMTAEELAVQSKTITNVQSLKIQQQPASQEQYPIETDIQEFVETYKHFLKLSGVNAALILPQTVQYFVLNRSDVISRIACYYNSLYNENKDGVAKLLSDIKNTTTDFNAAARQTFVTANQFFVTDFLHAPSNPGLMNCYVYFLRLKFDVFNYYQTELNLTYAQKSYLFLCAGLLVVLTAVQQFLTKTKEASGLITLVYIMFYLPETESNKALKVVQSQEQLHPEVSMASQ